MIYRHLFLKSILLLVNVHAVFGCFKLTVILLVVRVLFGCHYVSRVNISGQCVEIGEGQEFIYDIYATKFSYILF